MVNRRLLAGLIPVVLCLSFLPVPIDATTVEMDDAKNETKNILTNLFNSLFSETADKFSNPKYGIDITFPKNWAGIEMDIVPMALLSPTGFNFSEIFSTIADQAVSNLAESIGANETEEQSEQRKQEFIESFSNNLTQEFGNMTSTMGVFIHDKEVARLANTLSPDSKISEDSLTSIFERLMLTSDSTTVCERKTLDIITINNNINAEKSTQECLLTDSNSKRNNLNYFILTPDAIVGIIFSSESANHDEKHLRDFEESLKTLSVKEWLPINNQTIHQFLDDGTKNDTDSLLNETVQNFMNILNGNELLSQGKYEEAIKMYDARLGINPDDLDAIYNKGVALHHLGKYDEAISSYNEVLALDANHVNAVYGKGAALDALGRFEEAISWYNRALVADPKNVDSLNGKGLALSNLGRYDESIVWFDKMLEIDPKDVKALTSKGVTLANLGKYEEAISWYDKALEIDPTSLVAINNKGITLADLSKYEEAIVLFDKALAVDPNNLHALMNKASVLSDLGRYAEAIGWYDKFLDINPNEVTALDNKGVALFHIGKYEEAIFTYDKVLAVDSKNVNVLNNKGSTLAKLGKYDEAIVWIDKALEIDPVNVDALTKKGAVLFAVGKQEDALRQVDKALTIDPTNQIALDLKSLLIK